MKSGKLFFDTYIEKNKRREKNVAIYYRQASVAPISGPDES